MNITSLYTLGEQSGKTSQNRSKPVVGETLYDLNIGNAARNTPQVLTPVIVRSVGRKYFTCSPEGYEDKRYETKFRLEDWREESDYSTTHCLYTTEQEWSDEKEKNRIIEDIRRVFSGNFLWEREKHLDIPLEKLRVIDAILHEGNEYNH